MDRMIYGANWYVDTINQRLRLAAVQLPELSRAKETIVTGGGWFAFDNPGEIEGLEARFTLTGAHEDVRSLFGREPGDWTTFYYYERLRDITKGVNRGRVVILKGLVGTVRQPQIRGKRGGETEYSVSSMWQYQDLVDGKVIHRFDIETNTLIMNGLDYTADHNRLTAA
ncbi:phage major tail tube protein [Amorphus sp. MBR-141]